ncbi:CaiB/BaiF CoA-transferase family protein [Dactylosporangium sp. NPDC051485]|uniref:CaiB/BaiF CoA transferase family protein n=1 Tax=Dactylosporangium sp. NPDC051485 TaxID=3154846 RepID=UPI00342ABA79
MAGNNGILAGFTVVDCSELLPGPNATRLLSALGARVIKVERPDHGDRLRSRPFMFEAENRGKESIAVDLKNPAGLDVVKKLVGIADVFVEGYRPGVLDRLGLGFETLRQINPGIVYLSVSGYGQSGPYRNLSGHDFQYLSFAGAIPAPKPEFAADYVPTSLPVADMGSALYGVLGVVLALFQKRNDPDAFTARHLDVAMADCALALMEPRIAEGMVEENPADALRRPAYGVFETKDGGYVTIGAIEDKFFVSLVTALGLEQFIGAPYATFALRKCHYDDIQPALREKVKQYDRDELVRLLIDKDVPVAPVNNLAEPTRDAHFLARGMVYDDGGSVRVSEWPAALDGFASRDRLTPSPELGEDTYRILSDLGLDDNAAAELIRSGAVRSSER